MNNFAASFQLFKGFLPTFTTTPDPFLVRQRAEKRALPPLTRWSGQCSNGPGALQGDRVILGGNPLLRRSVVDDLFWICIFFDVTGGYVMVVVWIPMTSYLSSIFCNPESLFISFQLRINTLLEVLWQWNILVMWISLSIRLDWPGNGR